MVHIEVSGPEHSKKGYVMVEIARVLRSMGCEVIVQGEQTHLADKVSVPEEAIHQKLSGVQVSITEMKTRS